MATLKLTTRASVVTAAREYDDLGPDEFLKRHHFGRAREYFLLLDGKYYDSKAICWVAFGVENPSSGKLRSEDFIGGEQTVARELERLGFTVVRRPRPDVLIEPLVLVENEVTYGGAYDHWADETGARYHFPNQYRGLIQPGRRFVYYRGVRRAGGRRGSAEYFGVGRIGEVWRDESIDETTPKGGWRWYCSVDDHVPFDSPVPVKQNGQYFEDIKTQMGWRTGVRVVPEAIFGRIVQLGGLSPSWPGDPVLTVEPPRLPSIESVVPVLEEDAAVILLARRATGTSKSRGGLQRVRRSRAAKAVGDRAEEIVYRWLRQHLSEGVRDTVDWVAQRGETPGYDMRYERRPGEMVGVEVKGTVAGAFTEVELTAGEWQAAQEFRGRYHLYLVAACGGGEPRMTCVEDPWGRVEAGAYTAEPTTFCLRRR